MLPIFWFVVAEMRRPVVRPVAPSDTFVPCLRRGSDVNTRNSPPIELRPYSVPCGPLSTSMRSMSRNVKSYALLSIYGMLSTYIPTAGVFMREPMPRIYTELVRRLP